MARASRVPALRHSFGDFFASDRRSGSPATRVIILPRGGRTSGARAGAEPADQCAESGPVLLQLAVINAQIWREMRTHYFPTASPRLRDAARLPPFLVRPAVAQQLRQPNTRRSALAPPQPYKPVTIKLPTPVADRASCVPQAGRRHRAEEGPRREAKLVAASFFFINGERCGRQEEARIDNLSKAIGLDGKDSAAGWPRSPNTQEPPPSRRGAQGRALRPRDPAFDETPPSAPSRPRPIRAIGLPVKDASSRRPQAGRPVTDNSASTGAGLSRRSRGAVQGPISSGGAAVRQDRLRGGTSSCRSATSSSATPRKRQLEIADSSAAVVPLTAFEVYD